MIRWVIRWVITDHPPDHPLLSPSSGTEKVIRKGLTPFAPYIILYKGGGRGVGFCLSTRGPSIVQGPTFQTGPLPEMGWSPLLGMVGWISGAEVHVSDAFLVSARRSATR